MWEPAQWSFLGRDIGQGGIASSTAGWITAIAVQADNEILVAGGSSRINGYFQLARFTVDGQLDTTFGDDGTVGDNLIVGGWAYGIAVQSDGGILVAGELSSGTMYEAVLARYCPGSIGDVCVDVSTGQGSQEGQSSGSQSQSPPVVSQNPVSQSVDAGSTVTFTAAATGSPTPTVQWDVSTNGGTTFTPIAGAVSTTYAFTATAAVNGQQYQYKAVFRNAAGTTTTTTATLTVDIVPDAGLLAAVRQALGIPANVTVTVGDWELLTSLTADSNQVQTLQGLQYAKSLKSLTLVPTSFAVAGHLTDLSPLAGLPLTSLTLQDCGLGESSWTLPSLPDLQTLDLRYNAITTVPSVANLPKLTSLLLYGNRLSGAWYSSLAGKLLTVDIAPNDPANVITYELTQYEDTLYENLGTNQTPVTAPNVYAAVDAAFYDLPIEIYQYLVNTIQYQPYQGAMKGPLAVLQTSAGNDWDTDSLLANLFSAVGISTQYNSGRVVVDVPTVMNWLGVKTPAAAYDALTVGGMNPLFGAYSNGTFSPSGATTASFLSFDHVWLEATVTSPGSSTETAYVDPTWKFDNFQPGLSGMLASVPFAASDQTGNYLNSSVDETAADFYAAQVRTYLAENDSNTTIADVPYGGPIHPQTITALPTASPYAYITAPAQAATNTTPAVPASPSASSGIPPALTHQVQISVETPIAGYIGGLAEANANGITTTLSAAGGTFSPGMKGQTIILNNPHSDLLGDSMAPLSLTISQVVSTGQIIVTGFPSYYLNLPYGEGGGCTFTCPSVDITVFSAVESVPSVSLDRITIGYAGSTSLKDASRRFATANATGTQRTSSAAAVAAFGTLLAVRTCR